MVFVSITRLRIRSWRYLPAFLWGAFASAFQARRAEGSLAVFLLADGFLTYWTYSVWRDEAAMRQFMIAGSHRTVMPKLMGWCDEASVAHWQQAAVSVPDWFDVHRRMQTEGRASKVANPSEAHQRFELARPRGDVGQLRFKLTQAQK